LPDCNKLNNVQLPVSILVSLGDIQKVPYFIFSHDGFLLNLNAHLQLRNADQTAVIPEY
jgi:hypothetical protein